MCIDDFATKKRETYGTVMIDIGTHRIIDMIETREIEPVTEWLKSYPNLRVVSRDGSITYKSAIEAAHPKAAQVSDRFHLLKNLTTYATEYLKKELNVRIQITSASEASEDTEIPPMLGKGNENRKLTLKEKYDKIEEMQKNGNLKRQICKKINMDVRTYDKLISMLPCERETLFSTNLKITHEEKVECKMKLVNEVRELKAAGFSNREISKRIGIDHRTVAKYIDADFNPVHAMYGAKKAGILTPYMQRIDSMLENGAKGTDIVLSVQAAGYTGSSANVRQYISDWKKRRKHLYIKNDENEVKTEILERKDVFKLLFKPIEKVKCVRQANFDTLCAEYPCFAKIHSLVWEFRDLLKSKDGLNLFGWLRKAKSLNIREINSFCDGIERDFIAVYNAVSLDYSNGLAEGKVNKIKLIKRIMYGRNSFSTLKNKVLSIENPNFFNYLC